MDVISLIESINDYASHFSCLTSENAEQIISYIFDYAGSLNLRVSHEPIALLEEINQYKNGKTESRLIRQLRSSHELFLGATPIDLPKDITPTLRLVLSAKHHESPTSASLANAEYNGIVLSLVEQDGQIHCKLMAMPPRDLRHARRSNISQQISRYEVFEVRDGTVLVAYYDPDLFHVDDNMRAFRGRWCFASRNSYDLSRIKWRGYEYDRVLADVFGVNKVVMTDWQKNRTYCFGFRHPAYHPFQQPLWCGDFSATATKQIWLIQVRENHKPIAATAESGLTPQPKLEHKTIMLRFNQLDSALNDYLAGTDDTGDRRVFLGLIFRAKEAGMADLIFESSLWREIRKLVYQMPFCPNRVIRDRYAENFKNMDYVVLDAFLDIRKNNLFIRLFPQYAPVFVGHDDRISALVEEVYQLLECKPSARASLSASPSAERFAQILGGVYQTAGFSSAKSDKRNIRNLLMSPKYIDLLMENSTPLPI